LAIKLSQSGLYRAGVTAIGPVGIFDPNAQTQLACESFSSRPRHQTAVEIFQALKSLTAEVIARHLGSGRFLDRHSPPPSRPL
jgi:hypothetical protein